MKVLITGARGFIAGYLIRELLEHGYDVVGVDKFDPTPLPKDFDRNPQYRNVWADVADTKHLHYLLDDVDYLIANAALVGGIRYFHKHEYDLLAENERITAATFDAAILAHQYHHLKRIIVMSSSMVYERAMRFPVLEGQEQIIPPPLSSYGFQKLMTEYFARAARAQYGLPYTIIRPFNAVGVGEADTQDAHVIPNLVGKLLKGHPDAPLEILGTGDQVRHYTYAGDIARGIRLAMENPLAENEDFNIATNEQTSVLELAAMIWMKIKRDEPFYYVCYPESYSHDVQQRIPDTTKAKQLLGFEATTPLDTVLDQVIEWMQEQRQTAN